ncbi:phage holin family protein [Clostridium gasigenes]|uniref:Toxin secretion/phage lysis holin n=1 Tax=Clostridium gasigenes TaxID=94869 RepID=A0A1H0M9E2_9CLOT|nr:phage holin family protein [Clostridium gasigenes]SDO76921.1 toxin secretion/phage lysis holin [Clostridium gasigenes]
MEMEFLLKLKEQITLETIYYIFTILVATDIITGVIKAWKKGGFKSRSLRDGMFGSLAELILLILCILASKLVPITSFIVFVVLLVMIFKELSSIVENLVECGAKLPTWLTKGLKVYTDKLDNLDIKE